MTLDARALVEEEGKSGDYTWYRVEPRMLYPHSLLDLVNTGYITEADAILAIRPKDGVEVALLTKRAETLERARIHFTQRLIAQVGDGVGLHILKDLDWRL